jgi:outer membrane protein assembly factor BamD
MLLRYGKNIIIIIVLLVFVSACNNYKKLMKSTDYEKKYEKALAYFNRGKKNDYLRAQTLFEELRTIFKATDKAEHVVYYYAMSTYNVGEFTLAGYLFKDFGRQFPMSSRREECAFLSAYCYYLLSPLTSLEQTDTETAINSLQYFVEKYPQSEKRTEAEKYIDELSDKLEQKAFDNAMLYFTIGDYKAATVALKNVTIDHPNTKHREEILFTIVKSTFLLAENSVPAKRLERYKSTIDNYYIFIDNFPHSKRIKEAEKYFNNSQKFIEKNGT